MMKEKKKNTQWGSSKVWSARTIAEAAISDGEYFKKWYSWSDKSHKYWIYLFKYFLKKRKENNERKKIITDARWAVLISAEIILEKRLQKVKGEAIHVSNFNSRNIWNSIIRS